MLSISVTGTNNNEGQQELSDFDVFMNRSFNESTLLQVTTSTLFEVPIQDTLYAQQQTNLIHQAHVFQGVNLIYSVNTDS